ncbi:hypothetical protein PGTUg99_007247 [Puccinia graminis f. sp. tritici]|uniref:Uncharacterized protein n=1 Tax=Puccinia graminis f. sp. tritici TaxID=56615 RepID=A0A5B0RCW0_PUCGR|nr:hypothetical protein PGTUg99_007247 [Puccinia graminis f. sp. tritici]
MFRYSTDQGLVPVLSKKMAISLADDQKNMRLKGGTPHLNPSCPNNVLRYFHSSTQSTTSTPSFSPPTRSPSARSPLSAAPPSSSTPSSNHSKHPKDPTIPHGGASTPLSNSPTSRAHQFKTTKGHKTMSTGYGSLRTISGVYQGRASSEITDEPRLPVPALDQSLSDRTQEPQPLSSPAVPRCLPQSSSNPASQPPSPRPSPPLTNSQPHQASDSLVVLCPELSFTTEADSRPDRLSVLPPLALPLSTETAVNTTAVVEPHDTLLDSAAASLSFTAIAATSSTTSRPIEDPKAVLDRSLSIAQSANRTAEKSLNATLIPVTTPSNSDAELAPPPPSPSSLSPHSISTTITNAKLSPPPSTQPNPTHPISDTTNHHPLHPLDRFSPPECGNCATSMSTSKPPSPSVSTVDNTKPPTVPLTQPNHPDSPSAPSPINSTLLLPALPDCSIPIYSTAPACPVNLEIAAIGSLTVENDYNDSITAQIAPEYSQATLDYYNDIQEYLQQANADETETKKKKKKKKKANPTSTPDNPILFYTAEIFLSCLDTN